MTRSVPHFCLHVGTLICWAQLRDCLSSARLKKDTKRHALLPLSKMKKSSTLWYWVEHEGKETTATISCE